jgi:DNA-binding winged helix-turn-helix (wHTH) protein/tetratricopeptide (TPR) repeat protein
MSEKSNEIYQFGIFHLNLAAHTLSRSGEIIKLTPKRFALLLMLLRNGGRVLEKREIIKEVWPGVVIEENDLDNQSIYSLLNNCISKLREALNDDRKKRSLIETIPGIGYRFMADVKKIEETLLPPVVAVLPFKQLVAQQTRDDFLGLGVAFTIITKIRGIEGITVRPGSSIIKYNSPNQDPLVAALELETDYLINGYIQLSHQQIRINVEFLRMRDKVALCAETYDADYMEFINVQDLIAERMAHEVEREIGQKLTTKVKKGLQKQYTTSTEAYLHYVEGRFYWNKFTGEALTKAITCFERAIKIDPTYARAYSGISDVYTWLGIYNLIMPPKDAFLEAKKNALIALSYDEDLAGAHTSLGFVELCHEWNWSAAESAFKKAIGLNPKYTTSHLGYSLLLTGLGRFEDALDESTKALEVDPVSRILHVARGITLFEAGRASESLERFERALELDPWFDAGYFGSALAYSLQKKYAKAVMAAEKAYDLSHENPINLSLVAQIYAMWRKKAKARKILDELDELSQHRYISPFHIGCVNALLNQRSQALECLKKAVEVRDPWLLLLNVDPRFNSIREDPCFIELLSHIGLNGHVRVSTMLRKRAGGAGKRA